MITLHFAKTPSTKAINFTTYSNTTAERTLHKIIITHITFIFTKRSFFKQFKNMMHTIDTQLLCRHLGCHTYHLFLRSISHCMTQFSLILNNQFMLVLKMNSVCTKCWTNTFQIINCVAYHLLVHSQYC